MCNCDSKLQEAHPVRLKKVLVIHAASFINQIMMILRPLIKSEMLSLLQFTPNGPLELFSENIVPEVNGRNFVVRKTYSSKFLFPGLRWQPDVHGRVLQNRTKIDGIKIQGLVD